MASRQFMTFGDELLVPYALQRLMQPHGWELVANARDADRFQAALREHRPDVVVADVTGPATMRVIAAAQNAGASFKLALLVRTRDVRPMSGAFVVAADVVVSKRDEPSAIAAALLSVYPNQIAAPSGSRGAPEPGTPGDAAASLSALTRREAEILAHLGNGLNVREISQRLSLAVKTVDNHKSNIMSKLGVRRQTHLVRLAIAAGLSLTDAETL